MRVHPEVKVRHISPNRYHPRGAVPSLIVLHDTEGHTTHGDADLEALAALFANPTAVRSCHVATNAQGHSGRYVLDEDAAWQCVAYNRFALGIEQIGFASQHDWPQAQLKETARWIARWSLLHGIPIRRARTVAGRVLRSGVATHASLGSAGGGHSDPGANYPVGHVLDLARGFRHELHKVS